MPLGTALRPLYFVAYVPNRSSFRNDEHWLSHTLCNRKLIQILLPAYKIKMRNLIERFGSIEHLGGIRTSRPLEFLVDLSLQVYIYLNPVFQILKSQIGQSQAEIIS